MSSMEVANSNIKSRLRNNIWGSLNKDFPLFCITLFQEFIVLILIFSAKYNASGGAPGSQSTTDSDSSDDQSKQSQPAAQVHGKHDLLVWFEVLELGKWDWNHGIFYHFW